MWKNMEEELAAESNKLPDVKVAQRPFTSTGIISLGFSPGL